MGKGVDPIEHRTADRAQKRIADIKTKTFDQCAEKLHHCSPHRMAESQTRGAMEEYVGDLRIAVSPVFGSLPVGSIDVGLVIKALEPIWATKPETAKPLVSDLYTTKAKTPLLKEVKENAAEGAYDLAVK